MELLTTLPNIIKRERVTERMKRPFRHLKAELLAELLEVPEHHSPTKFITMPSTKNQTTRKGTFLEAVKPSTALRNVPHPPI